MMTKNMKCYMWFFIWLMSFLLECSSKPLDSEIAERLQELSELSPIIARSQLLSDEQWILIEKSLAAADDVSVAVATLFLQRVDNERSRAFLFKIGASNVQHGLLADAVLKTGELTSELANAMPDECISSWREMATDPNPYSRITAAKALCAIDPNAAKAVLLSLEEEKSEISPVANRIRRELAAHMGEELPLPIPGFESLYAWFEISAGSLAKVQFGGRKNTSVRSPYHIASTTTSSSQLLPGAKKEAEVQYATKRSETPTSSTPWSVIVILIVAAIGLLWSLLKLR
jgi:hypothetical protein